MKQKKTLEQILIEKIELKKDLSKIFSKEDKPKLAVEYILQSILLETVLYEYENQSQDEAV